MSARSGLDPKVYYRLTWQLLIVVAAALVVAADAARIAVVAPLAALAFVLVSRNVGRSSAWRRKVSFGLAFALVCVAVDRLTSMVGVDDFIRTMVELIFGSLPFMLLNHERPRSYWLATMTIAVIAVGSISVTTNPLVYVGFIGFMVLLLFNLNAANLHLPDAAGQRLNETLSVGYFRQFLYVLPAGLVSAILIFVLFPRARTFQFNLGLGLGRETGYSGAISLSGDGEIDESERVVMLVESALPRELKGEAARLLLRGDALDSFDGKGWKSSIFDRKSRNERPDLRVAKPKGRLRSLTFHLEPSALTTIFYPGSVLDVSVRSPGVGEVQSSANGSLNRRGTDSRRVDYAAQFFDVRLDSAAADRTIARIAADARAAAAEPVSGEGSDAAGVDERNWAYDPPASIVRATLEIPEDVRTAAYFKAWRDEVPVDPQTATLPTAVDALRTYFQDRYKWTLGNEFSGADPLKAFLTDERHGHCEYFATATALYLRALGVPTRVVIGFKGGTYNALIDRLEVRDANAHAWVESLIPGFGWWPIDLTPGGGVPQPRWFSALRLYGTAVTFWFRQYVVDYNAESQHQMVERVRELASHDSNGPVDWRREGWKLGRAALLLLALVAAWMVLIQRRLKRVRGGGLPPYYEVFRKLAAAWGLTQERGETFARFHARVRLAAQKRVDARTGRAGLAEALVAAVDAALEQDLYAEQPVDEMRRRRLSRDLEDALRVARAS